MSRINRRYIYQRSGGPILSWRYGAIPGYRAAETRELGSLGGSSLDDPTITLPLPRPGAPEPVGDCGCGSKDVVNIDILSPSFVIGAAVGAFILSKLFK